jgi:hypothetical protein
LVVGSTTGVGLGAGREGRVAARFAVRGVVAFAAAARLDRGAVGFAGPTRDVGAPPVRRAVARAALRCAAGWGAEVRRAGALRAAGLAAVAFFAGDRFGPAVLAVRVARVAAPVAAGARRRRVTGTSSAPSRVPSAFSEVSSRLPGCQSHSAVRAPPRAV